MKGKITAVLIILVVLLVLAVVCIFLTSLDRKAAPEPTPQPAVLVTEPAVAVETPTPTNEIITPQPVTPVPVSEPNQNTQPAATAAPTPTPESAPYEAPASGGSTGVALGSGSFRSSTGNNIDIRAEWEAVTAGSSQVEVTVTVYLESYALHMSAVPNSVNISLNGQYASLGAPAVDYDGGAQLSTKLASQTITVECNEGDSRNVGLQAEWHFGGTYGGVDIPVIECGGEFTISR